VGDGVESVIRGLAENIRIPSNGGGGLGGLKLLKNRHMIFERSLMTFIKFENSNESLLHNHLGTV